MHFIVQFKQFNHFNLSMRTGHEIKQYISLFSVAGIFTF